MKIVATITCEKAKIYNSGKNQEKILPTFLLLNGINLLLF